MASTYFALILLMLGVALVVDAAVKGRYVLLAPPGPFLANTAIVIGVEARNLSDLVDTTENRAIGAASDASGLWRSDGVSPMGDITVNFDLGVGSFTITVAAHGDVFLSLFTAFPDEMDASDTLTLPITANYATTPASGSGFLLQPVVLNAPNHTLSPNSACTIVPAVARKIFATFRLAAGASAGQVILLTDPLACSDNGAAEQFAMTWRIERPTASLTAAYTALFAALNGGANNVQAALALDVTFAADGGNAIAAGTYATVVIPGVDCTSDSWSAWSVCPVGPSACTVNGTADVTRSRVCPPETQTDVCVTDVCVSCPAPAVCAAVATCAVDAVNNVNECTCPYSTFGDGRTCRGRTDAEWRALIMDIVYASLVPGTNLRAGNVLALVSDAVYAALSAAVEVNRARFALEAVTYVGDGSSLTYHVQINPPVNETEATGAELLAALKVLLTASARRAAGDLLNLVINGNAVVQKSAAFSLPSTDPNASTSSDWNTTDTMYLLIALFSTALVSFFIMALVLHKLVQQRAAGHQRAAPRKAKPGKAGKASSPGKAGKHGTELLFPEAEANPTQYWASQTSDVNEPMRHFYPSSKLLANGEQFSGY